MARTKQTARSKTGAKRVQRSNPFLVGHGRTGKRLKPFETLLDPAEHPVLQVSSDVWRLIGSYCTVSEMLRFGLVSRAFRYVSETFFDWGSVKKHLYGDASLLWELSDFPDSRRGCLLVRQTRAVQEAEHKRRRLMWHLGDQLDCGPLVDDHDDTFFRYALENMCRQHSLVYAEQRFYSLALAMLKGTAREVWRVASQIAGGRKQLHAEDIGRAATFLQRQYGAGSALASRYPPALDVGRQTVASGQEEWQQEEEQEEGEEEEEGGEDEEQEEGEEDSGAVGAMQEEGEQEDEKEEGEQDDESDSEFWSSMSEGEADTDMQTEAQLRPSVPSEAVDLWDRVDSNVHPMSLDQMRECFSEGDFIHHYDYPSFRAYDDPDVEDRGFDTGLSSRKRAVRRYQKSAIPCFIHSMAFLSWAERSVRRYTFTHVALMDSIIVVEYSMCNLIALVAKLAGCSLFATEEHLLLAWQLQTGAPYRPEQE